uniref:Uncharacterized protein n=1 Tax=Arundo donax TaxID=35708 RepID=A0A0A9GE06_ARUDO
MPYLLAITCFSCQTKSSIICTCHRQPSDSNFTTILVMSTPYYHYRSVPRFNTWPHGYYWFSVYHETEKKVDCITGAQINHLFLVYD